MTDQQIFEEQRIAQGETEARMSLIVTFTGLKAAVVSPRKRAALLYRRRFCSAEKSPTRLPRWRRPESLARSSDRTRNHTSPEPRLDEAS